MYRTFFKGTFPKHSLVLKRLRPSYTPPDFMAYFDKDEQVWEDKKRIAESAIPAKRVRPCSVKNLDCGNGLTVRYQIQPWRKIGYGMVVQERETSCIILEHGELAATVHFRETRNPLNREIQASDYLYECDATSESHFEHSAICLQAKTFAGNDDGEGDEYLLPKERLAEISELWIAPGARARLIWVRPLRMLLQKLFRQAPDCYAVALKAYPLEYAKDFSGREPELRRLLGNEAAEPVLQREGYLMVRRKAALILLYQKHLDFRLINPAEGWMSWPVLP